MPRSRSFSLDPDRLPPETRPAWWQTASCFRVLHRPDVSPGDAAEAVATLRQVVDVERAKLERTAYSAGSRPPPSSRGEWQAEREVMRHIRAQVEDRIDRAIAKLAEDPLAMFDAFLEAKGGDPRAVELFEQLALERIEGIGGSVETALRLEVETSREERLPDRARLLLDHASALGWALQVAEEAAAAVGRNERSYSAALAEAEAAFGPVLSGLAL